MMNRLQKVLLTKYPIIWNTRLVPVFSIMVIVHVIFLLIGYAVSSIDFTRSYHMNTPLVDKYPQIFILTSLFSIIIFIFWLFSYSKNNAFRAFYPQKPLIIYKEFLAVVFIISMIGLLPVTTTYGGLLKWQHTETLENCRRNIEMLNRVDILIPSVRSEYYKGASNEYSADHYYYSSEVTHSTDDSLSIATRNNPENYSLLNKSPYYVDSKYDRESIVKNNAIEEVKTWLRNEEAAKIKSLMVEFESLAIKNGLPMDLSADEWFKIIYRPDKFLVGKDQVISENLTHWTGYSEYYNSEKDVYYVIDFMGDTLGVFPNYDAAWSFITEQPDIPKLPYNELRSGYMHIIEAHTTNNSIADIFHICFYFVLSLSLIIFAIRLNSVKQFFLGLLYLGILFFITLNINTSLSHQSPLRDTFYSGFWLILFVAVVFFMYSMIKLGSVKKFKKPLVSMLILMSIMIYPLGFLFFRELFKPDTYYYHYDPYFDWSFTFSYLSVFILMFGIIYLIRAWKSLPEE